MSQWPSSYQGKHGTVAMIAFGIYAVIVLSVLVVVFAIKGYLEWVCKLIKMIPWRTVLIVTVMAIVWVISRRRIAWYWIRYPFLDSEQREYEKYLAYFWLKPGDTL